MWIIDAYGLLVGVLAIVAGAAGDRIGRRRLLLVGPRVDNHPEALGAARQSVAAVAAIVLLAGAAINRVVPVAARSGPVDGPGLP